MADSQHGRFCGCAECVLAISRRPPARTPFRETATVEQLRDAYEAALDVMQRIVEERPLDVFEPLRKFVTERGRKLR